MFGFGKGKKLEAELAAMRQEMTSIKNEYQNWGGLSSDQWSEFFSTAAVSSGVQVNSETAKRSTAVSACTKIIANGVAMLPLPIYERTPTGRQQIDHDLFWLLNESPYPTVTAFKFWEWMISSMLLRGDGIAQLMRDKFGTIKNIMPLPRECVVIKKVDNNLVYLVNDGISKYGVHQDDILHFPGFGFDGVQGESIIRHAARQAVGTALAADEFSGEFFANGAAPSIAISYPENVAPKKDQQDLLREHIAERHSGTGNRHKPFVLTNGGKIQTYSMTAEDAQLLETRKFQVLEIARAFGVPPHMIGEASASTSWGSGIEQMSRGFVSWTLGPHLCGVQQELNRKIWPRSLRFFTEFDRNAAIAGDSKTEAEYFKAALGGPGAQGWMNLNEVRKQKNLPPDPQPESDKVRIAGSTPGAKPNEANATSDQQSTETS